ncbi:MAG: autotransporter domain-containing protein [Pseudomonas sp.]|uniref:autotransporter domain-containing protein n=1 Tax=Pseudomonas sp. TaxID=306 RepID=UPI0030F068E0
MRKKNARPFALCLLALACTSAVAAPMPYSTMVVFGDSLNDAGQFPDSGGPQGSYQRFTNRTGPTYLDDNSEQTGAINAMLLGTKLGLSATEQTASTALLRPQQGLPDGNNWATGGYTTANILASITSASIITDGGGVVLRQRPGYLAERNFKADPNALYYLNGGANDFFQSLVTNPTQADAAAGRLVDSARALQQAGGRYLMVWLLPDLGLTPAIYGTAFQSPQSQLSAAFNQTLVQQLAQVPAQIIPLNVPLLFNEVVNNSAAFGFISGTPLLSTCFGGGSCTVNPSYGVGGTTPAPSKLLFDDGVHPSTAGHQLIADYAYSLLAAPWELSLLPQMANSTLLAQEDALRREWQAGTWQAVGDWRAIINGGAQRQDFDSQASAVSAKGEHANLQVGGSYRLNEDWRAGLLAGAYRQHLKAGEADSRYKLDGYLGSAFMQFQHERLWLDAALTGGYLDYRDLQRTFALGISERAEQGNSTGALWSATSRVGFNLAPNSSDWQLSPFLSAAYSRITVDGYKERGQTSTALQVDEQTVTSKRLGAGLLANLQVLPSTRLFGELSHEHEFNNNAQTVTLRQKALPTLPYQLDGYRPAQQLNRLSLGLNQKLTSALAMQVSYSLDRRDDLSQQGVNLGLSLDF